MIKILLLFSSALKRKKTEDSSTDDSAGQAELSSENSEASNYSKVRIFWLSYHVKKGSVLKLKTFC